jgi:Beta-propeller repeat
MQRRSFAISTLGALVAACAQPGAPPPPTASTEQALNGMEGMFEFAIDLPWRIEPRVAPDGTRLYDPVPITIAIHDEDTNSYSGSGRIHELCKVTVSRYRDGVATLLQTFLPADLEWMEYTGKRPGAPTVPPTPSYWPTAAQGLLEPYNAACHPHTSNCAGFERIYNTSEWHGLVKWDPGPMLPGYAEVLELVAYVSSEPGCTSRQIKLKNYARAHWASDPLPRFSDQRWLYGDLHYHSQSTDNEGESGYSYRAVAEAIGALGMDFIFATDHASDSEQIVDIDGISGGITETHRGLRDLNQPRWDSALFKLFNLLGANADVIASWPAGRPRIPRLFLGAEVDVTPETALAPTDLPGSSPFWFWPYGNGRTVDLFKWTTDGFETFGGSQPSITIFDVPVIFHQLLDKDGYAEYQLADTQGLNQRYIGRQHVLYIPRFAYQPNGLVPSRTGLYGGATRRLVEGDATGPGVLPEIESKQGIAFLAHPLAATGGDKGPGMLPYSDYQYGKAFDQQALVGLQLWNEDRRVSSAGCFCGGILACGCADTGEYDVTGYEWVGLYASGTHMPGWNSGEYRYAPMYDLSHWGWQRVRFNVEEQLHNGAFTWDRLLRWGLDQGRTQAISWLPAGEPRRLFMAGGSDAHGDWNYRREGYTGATEEANDTAIAKVRNLVQAGRPGCAPLDRKCLGTVVLPNAQEQITDALGQGKFAVTDGPAVRLVVDKNRNGVVDDADAPMGSVVELYNGEALPILVQWETTTEFGAVDRVDLYVGVDSDPQCSGEGCLNPVNDTRARTYAPPDHGVRRDPSRTRDLFQNHFPIGPTQADPPANACAGVCQMEDGYWSPAEGPARDKLRYQPTTDGYAGTYAASINLSDYPSSGTLSSVPTRGYVRAFVRTRRGCDLLSPNTPWPVVFSGACIPRYGFTNPVWALRKSWQVSTSCPFTDRALDRDLDGLPDLCDAAPDTATGAGWSRLFGGAAADSAEAVAFDPSGNSYVVGAATTKGRIERDQRTSTPFSAGGADGLLVKYTAAGAYAGHLQALGTGSARFTDVAADGLGNVYVAGFFSCTVQLGGDSMTAAGGDGFVAKLRGSDLAVQWVYRLGGTGVGRAAGVAVTADGQVALAGDFSASAYFNGAVTAEGVSDCYLIRLTTYGQPQNLQRLGGLGSCSAVDVALDSGGHAFVAARYNGALRVGGITRTSSSIDSVIVRFAAPLEGYFPGWSSWLGDPLTASDALVQDLAVTPAGEVAAVGSFTGTLTATRDLDAAVAVGASVGGSDGFFLKLTATGAALAPPVWRFGGVLDDALAGVAVDPAGRLALTGAFQSPTLTTPFGTMTLTSSVDGMALVLDAAGQVLGQRDFGISGNSVGLATACSRDGRIATVGTISQAAQLDDRRVLASAGGTDGFLSVGRAP